MATETADAPSTFSLDESGDSSRARRLVLAGIWLIAVTLFAYLPVLLWGGFIWDDPEYVINNKTLRSVEGLKAIWTQPQSIPQYYPLVHTTFWTEYQIWGLSPQGYHTVNVLIHALNAILLWLVLARLKVPGAAIAAFIFALHPVEVESVAWITERKNTLSCFFYLSSLYVLLPLFKLDEPNDVDLTEKSTASGDHFTRENILRFAVGFLLFLCALGSKTVTASLPAAILVLCWWKHSRIRLRDIGWTAPLFVIGIVAGLYTAYLERTHVGASGDDFNQTFLERCLIAGRALWFYAGKLAWPTDLIFIYERWEIDTSVWWQWLFPIGVLAVVALLFLLRNRIGRGALAAVLLFCGTMFPAIGFLNVYPHRFSFVADHFQYHASMALIALAAAVGVTLVRRFNSTAVRWVAGGMVVALLCVYTAATMQQTLIYRDKETLWRDVIAKNDRAFIAYTNLATEVLRDAREKPFEDDGVTLSPKMAEALELLHRGLELYPDAVSYQNLGQAYLVIDRRETALPLLEKAVELGPNMLRHRLTLARAYQEGGEYEKAREQLQAIIDMHPQYFAAANNLARLYLTAEDESFRDPAKAVEVAEAGVEITRRRVPHLLRTLAAAYAAVGRYDDAVATAEETIALAKHEPEKFAGFIEGAQQELDDYRQLATGETPPPGDVAGPGPDTPEGD